MSEIYYKNECRDKIIAGVNKLNDAVSSTMGPNGMTVIIPDKDNYGKYRVTKDGVSVAKEIELQDPVENIGAQLIKQAAEKTVDEAGDGTTTSTVLAAAFVNNLKDFSYADVSKAFDEIIPKVIHNLEMNSRKMKQSDIKHVAAISANNDSEMGELIQNAFDHSMLVKVEETNNIVDTIELVNGMSLPVTYFSKHFVTDHKRGVCELKDPYVLILDGKLEKLELFREILEYTLTPDKSLLIITEHVHEQSLRKLESLVLSNGTNLCIIKSPGFSQHRKDLLTDLADFTNSTVVTNFNISHGISVLGKLQSASINKNNSILTKDPDIQIDELIDTLKIFSKSKDLTDYDKELINQRIENLTGKLSIIKVGGKTEDEMKERKDRYDDAVKAVACALEEGIVEGAGSALVHISFKYETDDKLIIQICHALRSPNRTIYFNMGLSTREISGMFEQNIIDPLKVTKTALLNAVAVAKTILSTNAVVLHRTEWKNQ